MLTASTVDGRKTAEQNLDTVDTEFKDVISCNSFVTNNPTAAASMSAQLWTVICNSKSVSMRQLPICKARSSSKGIFYRGRRAKYQSSPKEELDSQHVLNKRYKDSPEIVNAVNDWILNYDSQCDESTDTLDIAPEPKSLTHSAGAYYSSRKFSAEKQKEIISSHTAYNVDNYNLDNKHSFVSGDLYGISTGSRDMKQLLGVREKPYDRSGVSATERQAPSTKQVNQRKRTNHGYNKSGRRRSSNSMGSGKNSDIRSKIVYRKGAETERSNNRCESVESSICDDDTAKITKTLEPDDRRQEVVVCRPFLHKPVTVAGENPALREVVCKTPNKTLNNSNLTEGSSPQGVSQMSTVSVSPKTRFGDTYNKDEAKRKQIVVKSDGQGSHIRQVSAQSANDVASIAVSCTPDYNQSQKKASRCQLRRQVSVPKTRADMRNAGQPLDDMLSSGSAIAKFLSASPVSFDIPHPIASGAKTVSNGTIDDIASPPSVKKTRIKKLERTLPKQAQRRKSIKRALSGTNIKHNTHASSPKSEKSPNDQDSGQGLADVSSARIKPPHSDGKLGSLDQSDQANRSAVTTANTTPTRSSEHEVNETFTISPKLNHRSRKKTIPLKRPAGDVPETTKSSAPDMMEASSKRQVSDLSGASKRSVVNMSETSGRSAGVVMQSDSEAKDYDTKSTTSCNTSNIFSIIHEIVGDTKIQKIAPPVVETTGFAEPWPTSPKIKKEKEKKVRTPPAPPVKKRKLLKLYKRYRIPPKKTCSVAPSKLKKENAPDRKASAAARMSHRHRRSLNSAKKLTRASATETKGPVRVEQLSHRPARRKNVNKMANQADKKNANTASANSPTTFSDKGVQVKGYSSDESKTDTPKNGYYGNSPLNSEQIKSTVHKRLYNVRTNSELSVKSEVVPKHFKDFQRFIAMTRNAQSDNSFERVSDQSGPQSHGEEMDRKSSSVDAPHSSSSRKVSNNELDFPATHKADFINTLLSHNETYPPEALRVAKKEARHRHGIRTALKMTPDETLEGQENVYLKMLFNGGKTVPAPKQVSVSSYQKSDLSSSVDPLVYESSREPRSLGSPRTSMPYEREELKLSIPDAFLPYIRRAREYYVISQTLLHPQYKHLMRDRVSKSKEGSAPTSVSNMSEGKSISTANGTRQGSGSKEITTKAKLDKRRPQSKALKNVSKEVNPNKKLRGQQEKTKKQKMTTALSSPTVVKQVISSPKVKAKMSSPILLSKASSEKTVYRPNITKMSSPRQVSKQLATRPTLPVQQKKRSESSVNATPMKNRAETMAKRSVSREHPIRAANPADSRKSPKFDRYASPGKEKKGPSSKSPASKSRLPVAEVKERSSKQVPQVNAKVTAQRETSLSSNGSDNTLMNSSGDDKYKEPPSEAALRQTLAYLNYVKTGTRLKFPENEIQMIKYLSTSEPALIPMGTPSGLRQSRKILTHNRRSTAPMWSDKGNNVKLRKAIGASKGTANWKSSPTANQKGNSQDSLSKQKKRRTKKLNKKTTGTNSTNNKFMKSSSSSSQQSRAKSKSRAKSAKGPSYGSGIWQQPSNLRENLLLLSALNRCRNNSDRASDGIKDCATLYDLQSELSGRNVYIPKVLQNILAEREKSQAKGRLPRNKKKPRAVAAKFGAALRNRKVNPKRVVRKLNTKLGVNLKHVALTSRKPVTSQTITNMIKKSFTGKDMIGKSIHGLVSDLKSISETLQASTRRQGNFKIGENRPVFTRRPTGHLDERIMERRKTHADSSDSTLNSSQATGCDSELTSEESDAVMKDLIPAAGVIDEAKDSPMGSSGILQGGRKIWSAAYDRVVKMLSGKKTPVEQKHKSRHKIVKKRDGKPQPATQIPSAEKVSKRVPVKTHSMVFDPKYLHVGRDVILSKSNRAADPKSHALVKLGAELSRTGVTMFNKVAERNTRSNLIKRRVVKNPKEKQVRSIPVSRFHM